MIIFFIFIYLLGSTIFAGYFFSKFEPNDFMAQSSAIFLGLLWIFIIPLIIMWCTLYYPTKYFGNLFDKLNNK
jgi:Na+/H+-dicarboxylate symporter